MMLVDNPLKGIRDALTLGLCADILPEGFRDGTEQFNDVRIKLRTGAAQDLIEGNLVWHCLAVATVGSDSVVSISDCEDAGAEGDAFSGETIRIASAVEAFVMMSNNWSSCAKELNRFDDARSDHSVTFHLLELQDRQFGGFEENGVGNGDFADVMQQRSSLQDGELHGGIIGEAGQVGSVGLYAHGVCASLALTSIQGGDQCLQASFVGFVKLAEGRFKVTRAPANHIVEQFRVCALLAFEAKPLVAVFHRIGYILDRERFQKKIGSSKTDAAQHVRELGAASHKDDREVPIRMGGKFQQFRARNSWHMNVAKNNIESVARDCTYAILHIRGELKERRVFVESLGEEVSNLRFIIDHQDSRRRGKHAKPRCRICVRILDRQSSRDLEFF
jgi:hypothetical protein